MEMLFENQPLGLSRAGICENLAIKRRRRTQKQGKHSKIIGLSLFTAVGGSRKTKSPAISRHSDDGERPK